MTCRWVWSLAAVVVAGLVAPAAFAQQQQVTVTRDYDAEIRAAVQSAKDASGFEFLGTLVRTCLLPQSGGENTTDVVPAYVTKPAEAPAPETWYAEPARVFDNLYFVGGRVHSAWALTTSEGIILIDTIFPYNSEQLDRRRPAEAWTGSKEHQIRSHLARPRRPHWRRRNAADALQGASGDGRRRTGRRWPSIRTGSRRWRQRGTSWRPTA